MNILVKLNDVDISSYVISYGRSKHICTGIGEATVELDREFATPITTYDEIKIYEDTVHKGTYFVSSITDSVPTGTITLECQDGSKLLSDYFVYDLYDVGENKVRASDIIIKYLNEIGISYVFNTFVGDSYVGEGSVFGNDFANSIVTAMCQQCGWFYKFNADNTIIIGSHALGIGAASINAGDMTTISKTTNDTMARNAVKVWGGYDENGNVVVYQADENADWQRDSNDDRAIILSNGWIGTLALAQTLSNQLLTEYNRVTEEYVMDLIGAYELDIGDTLTYSSTYYSGEGIITSLEISMSKSGLLTKVTIGQRCPRQFAYYGAYYYNETPPFKPPTPTGDPIVRQCRRGDGVITISGENVAVTQVGAPSPKLSLLNPVEVYENTNAWFKRSVPSLSGTDNYLYYFNVNSITELYLVKYDVINEVEIASLEVPIGKASGNPRYLTVPLMALAEEDILYVISYPYGSDEDHEDEFIVYKVDFIENEVTEAFSWTWYIEEDGGASYFWWKEYRPLDIIATKDADDTIKIVIPVFYMYEYDDYIPVIDTFNRYEKVFFKIFNTETEIVTDSNQVDYYTSKEDQEDLDSYNLFIAPQVVNNCVVYPISERSLKNAAGVPELPFFVLDLDSHTASDLHIIKTADGAYMDVLDSPGTYESEKKIFYIYYGPTPVDTFGYCYIDLSNPLNPLLTTYYTGELYAEFINSVTQCIMFQYTCQSSSCDQPVSLIDPALNTVLGTYYVPPDGMTLFNNLASNYDVVASQLLGYDPDVVGIHKNFVHLKTWGSASVTPTLLTEAPESPNRDFFSVFPGYVVHFSEYTVRDFGPPRDYRSKLHIIK